MAEYSKGEMTPRGRGKIPMLSSPQRAKPASPSVHNLLLEEDSKYRISNHRRLVKEPSLQRQPSCSRDAAAFSLASVCLAQPSPLDRLLGANGRRERASQLGIANVCFREDQVFEGNQSLPALKKKLSLKKSCDSAVSGAANVTARLRKCTMERFTGNGLHSVSYSWNRDANRTQSKTRATGSPLSVSRSISLNDSWSMSNLMERSGVVPSSVNNPNKAVVTVDALTSEVLVANDTACRLFGYSSEELCKKRLCELLNCKREQYALTESHLEATGELILVSGKVLEAVDSGGSVFPVSVWIKKLEAGAGVRCLAVIEPVERTAASVIFDSNGTILVCDSNLATLHGYSSTCEVEGLAISDLIPSLHLPEGVHLTKDIRKQRATGRTKEGASFPLSILIEVEDPSWEPSQKHKYTSDRALVNHRSPLVAPVGDSQNPADYANAFTYTAQKDQVSVYKGIVWVFANISGMITLNPDGTIHSCNHYFSLMLFGYPQSQLVGKSISHLIPSFYDDLEFLSSESGLYPPYEDDEYGEYESKVVSDDSLGPLDIDNLTEHVQDLDLNLSTKCNENSTKAKNGRNLQFSSSPDTIIHSHSGNQTYGDVNGNVDSTKEEHGVTSTSPSDEEGDLDSVSTKDATVKNSVSSNSQCGRKEYSTSTPSRSTVVGSSESSPAMCILEGSYFGLGRHRDGSDLAIVYQVRRTELEDGQVLYCVWVSRDPEEPAEGGRNLASLTMASSVNSAFEGSHSIKELKSQSSLDIPDPECFTGLYGEHYTTLHQIGKGAFGCVRMAYRNSDKLLVVTKFIRKSMVYKECWVEDNILRKMLPLEVSLLTALRHPNIIQVIDVLENESYSQMVMEKHGCCMDLFEFIERSPNVDEPLASYIFRQVVSAVDYLHGLNILHRDVKDENIILDEQFHIKLIDFGSATFMSPNQVFATFCGTVEYCSPEVLQGNKYRGPELEMWSLGVTLYTLIFGENPFFDVEEAVRAVLHPPFEASKDLMVLVSHLLNPDPNQRCTLQDLQRNTWLHQSVNPLDYKFDEVVQSSRDEVNPPKYFAEVKCKKIGERNRSGLELDAVDGTRYDSYSELEYDAENDSFS